MGRPEFVSLVELLAINRRLSRARLPHGDHLSNVASYLSCGGGGGSPYGGAIVTSCLLESTGIPASIGGTPYAAIIELSSPLPSTALPASTLASEVPTTAPPHATPTAAAPTSIAARITRL